ncbi:MAG: hypothetical protein ACQR33_06315 [Candidatus Saccharibacteria bacterium]
MTFNPNAAPTLLEELGSVTLVDPSDIGSLAVSDEIDMTGFEDALTQMAPRDETVAAFGSFVDPITPTAFASVIK